MSFSIEVNDAAVNATLTALYNRSSNIQPVLQGIGEDIMARAKGRFDTGTGPDGQRWKPNTQATLTAFIDKKGGFGKDRGVGKRGKGINKKGIELAQGKKPLIGHSHSLVSQFHVNSVINAVTVSNSMVYAAMQQFGGLKSAFPHLWGDIPARPSMPIRQSGDLYPAEQAEILAAIQEHLAGE